MGEQVLDELRETVLPWKCHTSWEVGTVESSEMLQHLSSGCALPQRQHRNPLAWTGKKKLEPSYVAPSSLSGGAQEQAR